MPIVKLPGSPAAERKALGGKAWSIQRMQGLGVPVPPAFVITTDVCDRYYANGRRLPVDILHALPASIHWLEQATGRSFGGGERPLLVSVRSGAAISMPGMMDTVLNLGINDGVEATLACLSGSPDFAAQLKATFRAQFRHIVGIDAPENPMAQLQAAVCAVFDSWQSQRAQDYRRDRGLPEMGGTAVTVQAMVFGNLDERSGTGVMFTRNPVNGAPQLYGEWLPRGQGEDLVSGRRTPEGLDSLAQQMPEVREALIRVAQLLERDARDVQDIEFTVEGGTLWLLQSRAAKRSPQAAIRIAVELQQAGLLSVSEALDRITPEQVTATLRPHIHPDHRAQARVLARGKLASPGVASGIIVTDVYEAEQRVDAGQAVILARPTTDPEDVHAMTIVQGVLTELGGSTSHAAVVSREIGVPCIVGCGEGSLMALHGHHVTIDAEAGDIFDGELPLYAADESTNPYLAQIADWARAESKNGTTDDLVRLISARTTLP